MKPLKIPGLNGYPGGKGGSGTYQTIINFIPPCKVFASLFLGMCAVTRYMQPAQRMLLNEIDIDVFFAWAKAGLDTRYELSCLNAVEVLEAERIGAFYLDQPGVVIYLDPPYPLDVRKSEQPLYKHELTAEDHVRILKAITSYDQAKIIISTYPNALYDEWLSDWNTHDFMSQTRQGQAMERIYYNYELGQERQDYEFIGNDFREREKLSRIKKNMLSKLKRLDPLLRNAILCEVSSLK